MALKSIYSILQFPNQIEYANYMLQSIYNEGIEDIIFNGSKKELFRNKAKLFFRCFEYKLKDPMIKDIYENYNDFIIIKSIVQKRNKTHN